MRFSLSTTTYMFSVATGSSGGQRLSLGDYVMGTGARVGRPPPEGVRVAYACYATLFAVLAKAGLRPGEAFALKPGNIDWTERTVRVERAERAWNLERVKPTKTYEERTVDLTPSSTARTPRT